MHFPLFYNLFLVFVNRGPNGIKNFKTLLTLLIVAKHFQTFLTKLWKFWNVESWILTIFFISALWYCTTELLSSRRRPSSARPSVGKTRFLTNRQANIFAIFFSVLLTRDHMEVKVLNDISSERIQQICCPKFLYTPGDSLYRSC